MRGGRGQEQTDNQLLSARGSSARCLKTYRDPQRGARRGTKDAHP